MSKIENFGQALPPVTRNVARKVATVKTPRVVKPVQFTCYRHTSTGVCFISKKGDSIHRRLFEGSSFKECQNYLYSDDGYAELCVRWDIIKEQDNVSDSDVRTDSESINTWDKWELDGLTVERFHRTFPFRGVEFGDWVSETERRNFLQKTFVALCDLEALIGKLPLEGLGIAFGDRGAGRKASAHYEPTNHVINLTKRTGAGSLAHELFHSMDTDDQYSTQVMGYVPRSFLDRCQRMDKSRSKAYWATKREIGARVFESWVKDKMEEQGFVNEFLVNIISLNEFSKNKGMYPYLLESEKAFVYKYLDGKYLC
jgi:hypothetical protein